MPPAPPPSRAATLALVGGELAFDLANTASGRGGPRAQDHLRAAEHVVLWARHAGILTDAGARMLRRLAARPRLAASLLARTRELRALVYEIGTALAGGSAPREAQLDRLARVHAQALARARLAGDAAGFAWRWDVTQAPVEAILGPVTLSAIGLLTRAERARIKQCAGDHCGWLFLDTTKNNRRRWCEMEVCGNRAKQKRLRSRRQTTDD
jgi:predicted RNA-binding Zn ribbon-like protein